MEKCPVCIDGKVISKTSSAGKEKYCSDCRRIVLSSALGFIFTAKDINDFEQCSVPGDPRPGIKGPGENAQCYRYDPNDEAAIARAVKGASESAYAYQHKRQASKIVNSTAGFTGAPAALTGAAAAANPTPPAASSASQDFTALVGKQGPLDGVTAPGGMQPGNLNGPNPLNSGTTSSKRLAELITQDNNENIKSHMGPSFCTEHMQYDGCNHD